MAERMIRMTDTYAEFATNTQSAVRGRFSIPKWLCSFYRVGSGDSVEIRVEGRNGDFSGTVQLTSGTEIVAPRGSELYRIASPGARIKVVVYRPEPTKMAVT